MLSPTPNTTSALVSMRIISNLALTRFAAIHQPADVPLQAWRKLVESRNFSDFGDIKATFNSVDKVGTEYVFNVGGNKYRIVVAIHFNTQVMYIRHVFTHKEYDKWKP
jgi:mRNA interferase HigB